MGLIGWELHVLRMLLTKYSLCFLSTKEPGDDGFSAYILRHVVLSQNLTSEVGNEKQASFRVLAAAESFIRSNRDSESDDIRVARRSHKTT